MIHRILVVIVIVYGSAANACSIEIWPIEQVSAGAQWTVAGTVESGLDPTWFETPSRFPADAVVPTILFRVERVLKGEVSEEVIALHLSDIIGFGRFCNELAAPFIEGNRLLLMIGETTQEGGFQAPLVPPRVLRLADDYQDTPLFRYVEALVASDRAPVELEVSSLDSVALGAQIPMVLTATNHLDFPITLSFGAPTLGDGGGSLWFQRSDASPYSKPVGPEPLVLAPGQTGSISVDLRDFHGFGTIGHHVVVVNFDLLSGHDRTYTDRFAYFGFKVVRVTTAIEDISWGELKN